MSANGWAMDTFRYFLYFTLKKARQRFQGPIEKVYLERPRVVNSINAGCIMYSNIYVRYIEQKDCTAGLDAGVTYMRDSLLKT